MRAVAGGGLLLALEAAIASLASSGCGPAAPPALPAAVAPATSEAEFPNEPATLLRYHSARFKLSVALPDGRAWRIDDHRGPALVARHAATRSTLTLISFREPDLMTRQRCQERAGEMGLLAMHDPRTVEDATTVGPGAYDSRVWIAVEAGSQPEPLTAEARAVPMPNGGGPLVGHAILVGSHVHKCLFVHYATEVASESDEPTLTNRLVVARLRILGGLELEAFDEPAREREGFPRP